MVAALFGAEPDSSDNQILLVSIPFSCSSLYLAYGSSTYTASMRAGVQGYTGPEQPGK